VVNGGGGSFDNGLTCGLGPIPADGFANDEGFFAALSTTTGNVDCALDEGTFVVGPPTQIQITTDGGQYWSPIPLALLSFSDAIERVRLVPRPSGAWLLVQTRTPSGELGPVEARRLLASGAPDGEPVGLVPGGSHGFAAAPLGDGFAAAWIEREGSLAVALFDGDGAQRAAASIPVDAPATADPVALLVSPDASALLVAWSEGEPANVRLARFGCL
jgi:hypothetical protein